MLFLVQRARRIAGASLVAFGGLTFSAAALVCAIHPAASAAALAQIQSAVTCAVTGNNACVSGTDTSSGIGVLGASKTGLGVSGSAASNDGVKGASGSSYGVFGTSTSGKAGVAGTTANQSGVSGYTTAATGGVGVTGVSAGAHGYGLVGRDLTTYGTGVLGSVAKGTAIEGDAGDGGSGFYAKVTGSATGVVVSAATGNGVNSQTAGQFGVYASSTKASGYGAYGSDLALAGIGVEGDGGVHGGIGVHAVSNTDTFSSAFQGDASNGATGLSVNADTGFGIDVKGGTVGIRTDSTATTTGYGGDFAGSAYGIAGFSPTGYPIVLSSNVGTIFSVDQYGDVNYAGGLVQDARVANGATVRAYSTKTTTPTVEDTGTAQLVAGSAAVRLDPTFAASIDPTTAYRVFLTPDGDMAHGLFVALKSPSGFIVREMQGGRSSVTFDYRIVATALGKAGQRMAFANDFAKIPAERLTAPHFARRALPPPTLLPVSNR